MSFYIFCNNIPYARKANLVVVNRDINHETAETRQADRLLAFSSKKTFEMNAEGKINLINDMAYAKFKRNILLTSCAFSNEDEFLNYYKKIIHFAEIKKYDSIEIPFIAESLEDYKFYLKKLLILLDDYLAENELSIGIYTSRHDVVNDNLQLFNEFCIFVSKNSYEYKLDFEELYQDENIFEDEFARYNNKTNCFKLCSMEIGKEPPLSPKKKLVRNNINKIKPDMASGDSSRVALEEDFHEKLVKYINKSNKSNITIYTDGGISRQVFSKIYSTKDFIPKKNTIFCLIIGLELCLDDALDLLNAAGYAFSRSLMTDAIIKNHIQKGDYNLDLINRELDDNGEPIIGWNPRN